MGWVLTLGDLEGHEGETARRFSVCPWGSVVVKKWIDLPFLQGQFTSTFSQVPLLPALKQWSILSLSLVSSLRTEHKLQHVIVNLFLMRAHIRSYQIATKPWKAENMLTVSFPQGLVLDPVLQDILSRDLGSG